MDLKTLQTIGACVIPAWSFFVVISKTVAKIIKLLINYDSMCKRFDAFQEEVNGRIDKIEKIIDEMNDKVDKILFTMIQSKP